jgi:hypothetical protein
MKKIVLLALLFSILPGLSCPPVLAQDRQPDSEYIYKEDAPKKSEGGGLFDFLPFRRKSATIVESEELKPSPKPQASKPELRKREVQQLRSIAERWLMTSEFIEPTVRQYPDGRYYRDYIVFANEYEARVLRGNSREVPFIGQVHIEGDYFKTRSHETPEGAKSDFGFKYETRDFRLIFDRVEKWEYSLNPTAEPFAFIERWEYRTLQSRPTVNLSEGITPLKKPAMEDTTRPEGD